MTCAIRAICMTLLLSAVGLPTISAAAPVGDESANVQQRSDFQNSRSVFAKTKRGRVGFIGGSITEMKGYRPMVSDFLSKQFPSTEFTFINGGISSTCSTTGSFRLRRDLFKDGPVDLLFVEFAVNDDQDAQHAKRECRRGLEGILRQCLTANRRMDIVVTYFVNPGMIETYGRKQTPLSITAHEPVAQHYGVSTIHLAREVAQRIDRGDLTWREYGGTHPAARGNRICADLIGSMLKQAWSGAPGEAVDAKMPEPIDDHSYFNGRFLAGPFQLNGFEKKTPAWPRLPGQCRGRFAENQLWCADRPGAELKFNFTGVGVGAYVLAGPDAGMVDISIDGGPFRTIDLYHRFSRGLHYPRTVMFDADLKPGEHQILLRVSNKSNPRSLGQAVRVLDFAAN